MLTASVTLTEAPALEWGPRWLLVWGKGTGVLGLLRVPGGWARKTTELSPGSSLLALPWNPVLFLLLFRSLQCDCALATTRPPL